MGQIFGPAVIPSLGTLSVGSTWYQALLATVSMVGALMIMVPVTWLYIVTRRHRGFEESVVHTLLILPVAVTGIVMIVQSSLALAFSLAGIVAAVRFRTTLEDTKDAVYVFLAIGVGIASGVQAVGIALSLSLVFNAVVLVLWSTRFGNVYAHGRGGALGLGDVLAGPRSASSALTVGDPAVLEAAAPKDLAEIAGRAHSHGALHLPRNGRRRRTRGPTLSFSCTPPAPGRRRLMSKSFSRSWPRPGSSWRLAKVRGASCWSTSLGWTAPPSKVRSWTVSGTAPEGVIEAAEVRSLKGLKSRA